MTHEERFLSKTKWADAPHPVLGTPCLIYTAKANKGVGYGHFTVREKTIRAHRFAWEMKNGPIPPGLSVLHKCDNPACVNVEHLFLGTQFDNLQDMWRKGRGSRTNRRQQLMCPP